jgi:peptidyl-prolyl cis-trans isomerase C
MKRSILSATKLATILATPVLALSACKPPASPEPQATPEPTATPAATEKAPETEPAPLESTSTQPEAPAEQKFEPLQLPEVVATVNGQNITREQLQEVFTAALQGAGASVEKLNPEQQLQGYTQLLNDLIMDKLVAEASVSEKISEADIDAEIEKIKGQFPDPSIFEQQLQQSGTTLDKLKENIANMLQQQRWMQSQVNAPEVTDSQAQSFYDSNPAEFEQPETVEASHILFMVDPNAPEDIVKAKQDAATKAAERAAKGEDFNALAKELSEEPGADQSGGDLGYFAKDRMVPEFANAAFAQEIDAVGQPVRSQFGWHVIKVTGKKDAGKVPFTDVKDQIRAYLQSTEQRQAVQKVLENLKASAKIETFLPAAG